MHLRALKYQSRQKAAPPPPRSLKVVICSPLRTIIFEIARLSLLKSSQIKAIYFKEVCDKFKFV